MRASTSSSNGGAATPSVRPNRTKLTSVETPIANDAVARIRDALTAATSYSYTSGLTHSFYHYPARFAPGIAREVIGSLTDPGDYILDPFMGGGTAIIEGLALGRKMIGLDVNALAHFVTNVRTAPLSARDEVLLRQWALDTARLYGGPLANRSYDRRVKNLPPAVEIFLAGSLGLAEQLPLRRQRDFARCVLLRLGQWALDCRDFVAPRRRWLAHKLPQLTDEMINGMQELVGTCREAGIQKHIIRGNRILINRTAVGIEREHCFRESRVRPRLVLTSPPYPSVHVLYHRWQYRGRRETSAPYWIANVADGHHASFYMGGSRTPTGRQRYFEMIEAAFKSIRSVIHRDGLVVQLVGFARLTEQLPRYLEAMQKAGFVETLPVEVNGRLARRVPNRKWYAKLQSHADASQELLMFHRPA
jgi:hypothetical protein